MKQYFDVDAIRQEFPITKTMLYFDSAHQAPLAASVKAGIEKFLAEGFMAAGPKSLWLERVEQVRARIAALLGADVSEIAFTKNTSEGLNIAANALPLKSGDNVVMVHGDHPNNTYAFLHLQRKGVEIRFVPMTEVINAQSFESSIDERTRAISLSHVTFHAGHRFDVADVSRFCRQHELYLVVDAMQSIGILPVNVKTLGASLLACGSHKGLMVPQGLGLLYCDKTLDELEPAYLAAASLAEPPADLIARPGCMGLKPGAGRFEIGNYNLPAIYALSASLDLIDKIGVENVEKHVLDLGDHLIARIDEIGIGLVGPRRKEHRSNIYVLDLPVDDWLAYFSRNSVRVSPERDGIRVSFAMFNITDEIDRLVDLIHSRDRKTLHAQSVARSSHPAGVLS
jgi:selenocysteine lyase/cysteine desulfurase